MYCIDIAQAGKYTAHANDTITGPRAIPAPKSPSLLEVLNVHQSFLHIQVHSYHIYDILRTLYILKIHWCVIYMCVHMYEKQNCAQWRKDGSRYESIGGGTLRYVLAALSLRNIFCPFQCNTVVGCVGCKYFPCRVLFSMKCIFCSLQCALIFVHSVHQGV